MRAAEQLRVDRFGDHCSAGRRRSWRRSRVDDEALALAEIKAVGPGGNHLARPYTRKHFRQYWQSDLFDTTRHDAWEADGSKTLLDRLKARVAELRSEPRAFELPDDAKTGLDAILADVEAHRPGT